MKIVSTSAFPPGQEPSSPDLDVLRRFIRKPEPTPVPARAAEERCEMCAERLTGEHRHMLDLAHHKLLCACQACALLFAPRGANEGKYRLIPQRFLLLLDFQMTDEQWNELMLPVKMVYMFRSSEAGRAMAFYPGPAGAIESLLDAEQWQALLAANPLLAEMEPDVEALLINRLGEEHAYYLVPIDVCYSLVGLLRTSWKGLSGGKEVWEAITDFFAGLQARALSVNDQAGQEARKEKGTGDARTRSEF